MKQMPKLIFFTVALTAGSLALSASADDGGKRFRGDKDKRAGHEEMFIKKLDTNNDGVISREEFMSFHEERFNEMDVNKDGKITADEMEAARVKRHEKMKEMRQHGKKDK